MTPLPTSASTRDWTCSSDLRASGRHTLRTGPGTHADACWTYASAAALPQPMKSESSHTSRADCYGGAFRQQNSSEKTFEARRQESTRRTERPTRVNRTGLIPSRNPAG